jgi:phosphoserine aminotransferase
VYDEIHHQTIADLRTLLDATDEHAILFMGGGAQTQFALIPMNLLPAGAHADYLVTGAWSAAALREATKLGEVRTLWSSAATGYDRVPVPGDYAVDPTAAYLHYTSNNTIMGTQFPDVPEAGAVPLVCDMSSDLLSRPITLSRFGLIYAGAQKNKGPAGVTVVIIRHDVLERCRPELPTMWSYAQIAAKNSLQNTPPVFAIYIVGLVAQHLLAQGGLATMAAYNATKAALLYTAIDASGGFYRGHAHLQSRSQMNVTFHLPTPELDALFVTHSTTADLHGLQGHTGLGGIRASLYNAVQLEAVHALVAFMHDFQQRYG